MSVNPSRSGEWRNWQTRTLQGRVGAILWRFKSSLAHQISDDNDER